MKPRRRLRTRARPNSTRTTKSQPDLGRAITTRSYRACELTDGHLSIRPQVMRCRCPDESEQVRASFAFRKCKRPVQRKEFSAGGKRCQNDKSMRLDHFLLSPNLSGQLMDNDVDGWRVGR